MLGSCGRCERASVCFRRFDRVSIFSIEQFLKKKKKRLIIYYCITRVYTVGIPMYEIVSSLC